MTLNVDKMRRNLARNVPDAVWMDVDPMAVGAEAKVKEWRFWFNRMMDIKHGSKLQGITLFQSETLGYHTIRIQLHADLHRS